ncbi:MAG TPA: amidase [bacterium]|nr:amidase [bacterium]
MSADLAYAGAVEIARRVGAAEITARQVVEAFLERITALQPRVNAFTQILSDLALEQARGVDEAVRGGGEVGPLAGVPVAVKDIVDVAGTATTAAAHPSFHRQASEDAPVVARLRAAGAVLIGKTNLHEFAYGVTNINPHTGPTRNPWDPSRIPGGSSGGSAAAVAAGMAAGAVGTDTGGSIRIPAALCGVAGIKPTYGLLPTRGVVPLSWSLDHVGPLARSVTDLALLLGVMAGGDYLAAVSRARARGLRGVRIGVAQEFFWERADPEVLALAEQAVAVLRGTGAEIVEVTVPHAARAGAVAAVVMSAEATAYHEPHLRTRLGDYGEDLQVRLLRGFFLSGADYLAGLRARTFLRRAFLEAFARCDLLVTPTTQAPAEPIAADPAAAARTSLALSVQLTRYTNPFNVTGFPAASVPCGFTARGLPVGLQIVGRPFDDAAVLRVAAVYEAAAGGAPRRPLP